MSVKAADDFDFIKKRLKQLEEEQKIEEDKKEEISSIPEQIYYDGLSPAPVPIDMKAIVDLYKKAMAPSTQDVNTSTKDSGIPSDSSPIVYLAEIYPYTINFDFIAEEYSRYLNELKFFTTMMEISD